ncbi:MAG: MmgE/PrpD family protein [Cyanobacteria bacterium P01_F01_bin.150]
MTANESLAHWVATVSSEHTPLSLKRAKTALIDTLGCMVIGHGHPAAQHSIAAVSQWGRGASTAVGLSERLPAPWAALVNGTAAHALDLDDYNEFPSFGHPSAVLLPAVLALGEERHTSGAEVLDAFIVGLEVLMRVGEAVNVAHYNLGWHASATLGVLGAAAGCARLLGLNTNATSAALSIASSCAAGYNSQFGTMTKPLHIGLAAHSGVLAAQLAATGITASTMTLDGKWSFLTLLSTQDAQGFEVPLAKLGNPLAIDEYGLSIKRYPCCSATHRAIDGVISLRTAHRFSPAEVAAITVRIRSTYIDLLPFALPSNSGEAQFSMPYCVAVALLTGNVGFEDFTLPAINRPEVGALIPLVTLESHPLVQAHPQAKGDSPMPDIVTIKLRDGRILETSIDDASGMPNCPLSQAELWDKFTGCTQGVLGERSHQSLQHLLNQFEALEDLNELMGYLREPTS